MQTISSVDPALLDALPDALADALADVIAEARLEGQRDRERYEAETRATIAELRAEVIELKAQMQAAHAADRAKVAEALLTIKSGDPGLPGKDADPALVAELVDAAIAKQPAPLTILDVRYELEQVVKSLPVPQDGHSPSEDELEPLVERVTQRLLDARPSPKDGEPGQPGQSVTLEDVEPIIRDRVAAEVAALPRAEPGAPGKDADLDKVRAFIIEELEAAYKAVRIPEDGHTPTEEELVSLMEPLVDRAEKRLLDALPVPKDGEPGPPGQSVTLEDVAPLVREMVATEVAALPPAQAGEPGKDADPEQVRAIIVEELQVAVKAIPAPQDGHTPTEEELLPIVERVAQRVVDALPPAKDGEPGQNGSDGKDAPAVTVEQIAEAITPEIVKSVVAGYLEENPPPAGPPGENGKDAPPLTVEQIAKAIQPEMLKPVVAKYLEANPPAPGKDGVGVKDLLIDRNGSLLATRDDGSIRELGAVVGVDGKDGRDGADGKSIEQEDIEQMLAAPPELTDMISKAGRLIAEAPDLQKLSEPLFVPSPATVDKPTVKSMTLRRDEQGQLHAQVTSR